MGADESISKSQAFAELGRLREDLDKIGADIFRKVQAAEEAIKVGDASAEAKGFLAITQLISSQHELYNALFKTISAFELLTQHLEELWNKIPPK